MTRLGSIQGIQFSFEQGLLTSLHSERHRKPVCPLKEKFITDQPVRLETTLKQITQLDSPSSSSFENKSWEPIAHFEAEQNLGFGHRRLIISQSSTSIYLPLDKSIPEGTFLASLRMEFDITQPVIWQLSVEGEAILVESGASEIQFQLHRGLSIEIKSNQPLSLKETRTEIKRQEIQIGLPVGNSFVEIPVISYPAFDLNDTMIFCRPNQLREAAIVASCITRELMTPIFVVQPQPISDNDYRRLKEEHTKLVRGSNSPIVQDQMEKIASQGTFEEKSEFLLSYMRSEQLLAALTPLRAWVKRNELLRSMFMHIPIRRNVFLFDATYREVSIPIIDSNVREGDKISDAEEMGLRTSLFSASEERLFLLSRPEGGVHDERSGTEAELNFPDRLVEGERIYYDSLADLTDVAWQRLGPTGQAPEETIDVAANDDASFLLGLLVALRQKCPIRPVDTVPEPLEQACQRVNEQNKSDEAVLIELTGEALNLIGVLYAHYRNARLVILPTPDLAFVSVANGVLASKQKTHAGLGNRIKRLVGIPSWEVSALKYLEETVSEQVPEYVVEQIKDCRLTAFTTGLPYSFVKKAGVDWSHKPIGHVTADSDLIIFGEITYQATTRPAVVFNAVFDTDFFDTGETDQVLKILEQHFAYTCPLQGPIASPQSLMILSNYLPLEMVYFNTHGDTDGIMLGDKIFQRHKLVQWVKFRSRPVVFNNSCLSWFGAGREFLRIGARAYIGSLWYLEAGAAARFSQRVMREVVQNEKSLCEAIVGETRNPLIDRAYILIGTANTRLDLLYDLDIVNNPEFLLSAARNFLDTYGDLAQFLMMGQSVHSDDQIILEYVYQRIQRIKTRFVSTGLQRGRRALDYLLVLIHELDILSKFRFATKDLDMKVSALARTCHEELDLGEFPNDTRSSLRGLVYELQGRASNQAGHFQSAIDFFQKSISETQSAGHSTAISTLLIAEALIRKGDWEAAKQTALEAKNTFERENSQLGTLQSIGLLSQISLRLRELDMALEYAQQGFDRAAQLGRSQDQLAFALDRVNILMTRADYDNAIRAAESALEIARRSQHAIGELKASGLMASIYRLQGDLPRAKEIYERNLVISQKLKDDEMEASCLAGLGTIKEFEEDYLGAIDCYQQASSIFLKNGLFERGSHLIVMMASASQKANDWNAMLPFLVLALSLGGGYELKSEIMVSVFRVIHQFVESTPRPIATQGLQKLWLALQEIYKEEKDNPSVHFLFTSDYLATLSTALIGKCDEARKSARKLDEASQSVLQIENYIEELCRKGDPAVTEKPGSSA